MKRFSQPSRIVHTQHGVALLECLMALLIFSFGLLGLLGLEARLMNFSGDSEDRNRAAMFASELASQMWLNGTWNPATPEYTALQANINNMALGGLPGGIVGVAQVGAANAADITITWQPPSATVPSKLTTRVILP